jgi:uncharacterized protein YecE (DUF72 family)
VRVALEVREASWLAPEVLALLERYGWALCLADWPGLRVDGPATGPFVYVRRHGPQALYASGYGQAALEQDGRRVAAWLGEGRDVYVYFNNDAEGHAVRDASALEQLLGLGAVGGAGQPPAARRRRGSADGAAG